MSAATGQSDRTILHVDLDAFFAAVEQRDHPEWRGKPLVVGIGGANDRGVVSAASYEARKFGVHSAMPIRTARRLCPDCLFVPVRGAAYQAASREVMAILRRFTPLVEPVSIDEAFLDVTGSRRLFGDGESIARLIKAAIRDGAAAGRLGRGRLDQARGQDRAATCASRMASSSSSPATRRRSSRRCRSRACGASGRRPRRRCGTSAWPRSATSRCSIVSALVRRFGKHGASLVDRAHGVDPDPVDDPDAAKSVSHEHTFDEDTSDPEVLERTLLAMSEGVSGRLRHAGLKAGDGHGQGPRQRRSTP